MALHHVTNYNINKTKNMKKSVFLTLIAICMTFSAKAKEDTDTISYMTGLQVSYEIENSILPQLKLDYATIKSTISKYFATEKAIRVENCTITPDNIKKTAKNYFNQGLQARVMEAMKDSTGKTEVFTDPKEKKIVSTLIGADFAYKMKDAPYKLHKASFMKAIEDNHAGKAMFTQDESIKYMNNYYTVEIPKNNKRESEKWLAKTEKSKGVKKTASGILYKIEQPGDMNTKATKDEDIVKVLYTGTTMNGKVFDSNRWADMPAERQEMTRQYKPADAEKDTPIEFPLNRVIKGWTEGMKLIGKGGRIILWIPSSLAYGERGSGNNIGPNQALRFDVELLDVTSK